MPLRKSQRDDPQEPSTSTGPQRRIEANRKKFERFKTDNEVMSLWRLCTTKQRNKQINSAFFFENRRLRGLNFKILLEPHKIYLTDLSRTCSSTFAELCENLRFLAFHKKVPTARNDDAQKLFKAVASCVRLENDTWNVVINKETIMDKTTLNCLEAARNGIEYKIPVKEPPPIPIPIPTNRRQSKASTVSSALRMPRPFNPAKEDEHMRQNHYLDDVGSNDSKWNSMFDKLMKTVIKNNMANRTKDRQLSDIEYYADDVLLLSTQISFRLDNLLQIVDFKLPQFEDDGYFPSDREDHGWYLYEQYHEALTEVTMDFANVRPNGRPILYGFQRGEIRCHELLFFHSIGRHIQGFFEVWEETNRGWQEKNGKWISRRYLVDMYNQVKFPLYLKYELWPFSLKWAFDKVSVYGLKLMTLVKKHHKELKLLGDLLFSHYPSYIHEGLRHNVSTQKGRQQYQHTVQVENNRMIEKVMSPSMFPKIPPTEEDTTKKRKRRARKSDLPATEPKPPKTPRRALDSRFSCPTVTTSASASAPSTSVVRTLTVQKENMERILVPPLFPSSANSSSNLVAPHRRRQSLESRQRPANHQSTIKRRHDEFSATSSGVFVPPLKKPSLDSWDDHVHHNELDEEHVDEEEESEDGQEEMDDGSRQENQHHPGGPVDLGGPVWVPQDRGFEVAPEQYAKEILEHYGVKKEENELEGSASATQNQPTSSSAPSSASAVPTGSNADSVAVPDDSAPSVAQPPAPKQRRSRKNNQKANETAPEAAPAVQLNSNNDLMSSGAISHDVTHGNGTPSRHYVYQQKQNRVYSIKPATIPPNKNVYPVKKLTSSGPILNGVTISPSGGMTSSGVLASPGMMSSPVVRNAYLSTKKNGSIVIPAHQQQIPLSKEVLGAMQHVQNAPNIHGSGIMMGKPQIPYYTTGIRSKGFYPFYMEQYAQSTGLPITSNVSSFGPSTSSVHLNPVVTPIPTVRPNPIIRPITRTPNILQRTTPPTAPVQQPANQMPPPATSPALARSQSPDQRQSPALPSAETQQSPTEITDRTSAPRESPAPVSADQAGQEVPATFSESGSPKPEGEGGSPTTPAARALERIRQNSEANPEFLSESTRCRRGMAFNDQMAYKAKRWDPMPVKSISPGGTVTRSRIGTLTQTGSTAIVAVTEAPTPPPPQFPPPLMDDIAPDTLLQPPAADRSVGVFNSRLTVPWTAQNNRPPTDTMVPVCSTTSSMPFVPTSSTTPEMLLPRSTPPPPPPASQFLQFPAPSAPLLLIPAAAVPMASMQTAMPVAGVQVMMPPRTTTTAYTVMEAGSSQQVPPVTIRSYTNMMRKSAVLTPEELGDAVRTESQRFHNATGEEGPTVKSFLLNLQNK